METLKMVGRYLVAALIASLVCVSCDWQSKAPANQRSESPQGDAQDDISIGTPSPDPPRSMSPVDDSGRITSHAGGMSLLAQDFEFDPNTKEVRLDKSHTQQIYGNTLIDSAGLKNNKRLGFGKVSLPTNDSDGCAWLGVSFESHSKVLISSNYVVSPAEAGQPQVKPTDYSVLIVFDPSDGNKFIAGTLNVSRSGATPTRFPLNFPASAAPSNIDNIPLASTGFPIVELSKVRRGKDVVEWSVERDGKITHKGIFGFPVVGTVPKLVYYQVYVSEHKTQ